MLKVILAIIVFLSLLFPLTANPAIKEMEKDLTVEDVIKKGSVVVFWGLLVEKNMIVEGPLLHFEDRIITGKGFEYYLRLSIDPSSGTIIGFLAALHLYNPNMLYRVVLLDIYELDIDSVGQGGDSIRYKHFLKAFTIFYNEPGSLVADRINQDTLTREVFKDILKEFDKKYSGRKSPFRNHAFMGKDR